MTEPTPDDDLEDLLPDNLKPAPEKPPRAQPPRAQVKKPRAKPAPQKPKSNELAQARSAEAQRAARLAQVVNLHIAGYSLAAIGAAIGASEAEVDRMLSADVGRYVKSQPALRTYVRNWISERYMKMIEADWAQASDPKHHQKLEHQDRVDRFLRSMAKLHGADAPSQTEMKVEAAPEAVEKMVSALAAGQGLDYNTEIFDAEVVHDAAEQSHEAMLVSAEQVEQPQEGEPDDGFGEPVSPET